MSIDEYKEFDPSIFDNIRYLLQGQTTARSYRNSDAVNFLFNLGYRRAADGVFYQADDSSHPDDEEKLLVLAARLTRFFVVRPPQSPGLVFCAGVLDSSLHSNDSDSATALSVGGIGASLAAAFRRCLGEAVEYLSQVENAERNAAENAFTFHPLPLDKGLDRVSQQGLSAFVKNGLSSLDCLKAECFEDASDAYIPADLCVRRQSAHVQIDVPYKISSGCAVGPTRHDALYKAITEVIERDCVALWWYGGAPPRMFTQKQLSRFGIQALLERSRGICRSRKTAFLDISSDLDVPTVAAFSVDDSGANFVCGMAARLSMEQALEAAFLEMCQMELGLIFVALKTKQRGAEALSDGDRRQLERARQITPNRCLALIGKSDARRYQDVRGLSVEQKLDLLKQRIARAGMKAYIVDLTRTDIGIPALQVVIPELQPATPVVITDRLQATIQKHGGGWGLKHAIGLY